MRDETITRLGYFGLIVAFSIIHWSVPGFSAIHFLISAVAVILCCVWFFLRKMQEMKNTLGDMFNNEVDE